MQLAHRGIKLEIADAEVIGLVLERLNSAEAQAVGASTPVTPPRVGEIWPGQGGIYCGTVAGEVAGLDRDYYLIAGPEHDRDIAWQPALEWAPTVIVDGLQDFDLPFRKEQRIAYANASRHFKAVSYWSREQHAGDSSTAWGQLFDDGNQYNWLKNSKLRARVFRRLTI